MIVPPLLHLVNDTLRRAVPLLSTLVLLALSFAPIGMPQLERMLPSFALMGVFYWSVYRPDRFGIMAAFVIGALQDLLMGAPLGVTAFLFALVQRLTRQQQRAFKGGMFRALWLGYVAAQAITTIVQWVVWSLLSHAAYPPLPFVIQLVLALCLFPPVYWILSRLHAAFLHHHHQS